MKRKGKRKNKNSPLSRLENSYWRRKLGSFLYFQGYIRGYIHACARERERERRDGMSTRTDPKNRKGLVIIRAAKNDGYRRGKKAERARSYYPLLSRLSNLL